MSQGVTKDLANALDNFGPIAWLNNKCQDGALVKGAIGACVAMKDKAVDGLASAKDNVVDFAKDPFGKSEGVSEPEIGLDKTPKLGRSAERMAYMEAGGNSSGGLGTQEIAPPQQETFKSISGHEDLKNLAMNSDIVMDAQNYNVGQVGESITSVTAGTAVSAEHIARNQEQMALG